MRFFQNYDYVFIVTYGRSGSTLLQAMLNAAENCDVKGENNGSLYFLYRNLVSLQRAQAKFSNRPKMTEGKASPWYGIVDANLAQYQADCLDSFVKNVLQPTIERGLIGFKEIRYMPRSIMSLGNGGFFAGQQEFNDYCDFLCSLPNGKIIFNTRRAEAVVQSGMWQNYNTDKITQMIGIMDHWFTEYHASHTQTTRLLSYDDYTKDSQSLIEMIDFLGLSLSTEQLNAVLNTRLSH